MPKNKKLAIFEGNEIRRHWNEEKELWYFSVVDVVRVLTGSIDAGAYWRKLKQRLKEEGSEVVTKCHELKFMAKDGKYYLSDAAFGLSKLAKSRRSYCQSCQSLYQ